MMILTASSCVLMIFFFTCFISCFHFQCHMVDVQVFKAVLQFTFYLLCICHGAFFIDADMGSECIFCSAKGPYMHMMNVLHTFDFHRCSSDFFHFYCFGDG